MDHLWFITSRIYCICSYINIHDYFIFFISRVSWGYLRVYMVEPVVICLFSLMRLCKKEAEFVGRIGQKINLDSGVGSKRSDSTIIFSVSCHSNVTTFAPRCAPRIFDNPIVISIIRPIANNDHRMINFESFSPRCSLCLLDLKGQDSKIKIRLVSYESFGWTN